MQRSPSVLVVDDEFDISNSIKRGLEKKGFEVDAYTDPTEALAHYAKGRYDILLVDIRMPKMSGFEFVRAVRSTDSKVQFCFLTAFDVQRSEFSKLFPDVDVSHLLRKPITLTDLANILNQLVKESQKPLA
ncbi:MAG: response regulator [Thaumarchaeota archaeon]|nr:response regulator [Nitrososphaerota archaeon]